MESYPPIRSESGLTTATPAGGGGGGAEIILENYLLKKGTKYRFWHNRYFVFTADNVLRYYNKKGDAKPKASLQLGRLSDCEISELYVAKKSSGSSSTSSSEAAAHAAGGAERGNTNNHYHHSKHSNMLYCVKITWTADENEFLDESLMWSENDADTILSGNTAGAQQQQPQHVSPLVGDEKKEQYHDLQQQETLLKDSSNRLSLSAKTRKKTPLKRLCRHKRSKSDDAAANNALLHDDGDDDPLLLLQSPSEVLVPPTSPSRSHNRRASSASVSSCRRRRRGVEGSALGTVAADAAAAGAARRSGKCHSVSSACRRQARFSIRNRDDEMPKIPTMVTTHSNQNLMELHGDEDDTTLPIGNNSGGNHPVVLKKQPSSLLFKDERDEEKDYLRAQYLTDKKLNQRRTKRKVLEGTKFAAAAGAAVGVAAMTAGMGIVAGLLFLGVGAAAGGGGAAVGAAWRKKQDGEVVIASADYETIKQWKACLDAAILSSGTIQKSKWGQLFVGAEGNKRRLAIFPTGSTGGASSLNGDRGMDGSGADHAKRKNERALLFEDTSTWRPLEGGWTALLGTGPQGLRILREERKVKKTSSRTATNPTLHHGHGASNSQNTRWATTNLSVDGRPYAPLKSHTVLSVAPLDAFLCLMSFGLLKNDSDLTPNSGQRASFRIIETIDDNTDIIHLICNPLYLFPCWTMPRDFVLYRYWRAEHDGCFVVCYESVTHNDCPPHPDFVRGDMHQVFTIAPDKKGHRRKAGPKEQAQRECLMTAVVQVDPKGWIPTMPIPFLANQAYGEAFAVAALMQLLDIRDAIDFERFVPLSLGQDVQHLTVRARSFDDTQPNIAPCNSVDSDGLFVDDPVHYDFAFCSRESVLPRDHHSRSGLACYPPPLQRDQWAEPDANSFRVRGPQYKIDRRKINAGASIGRLVAVDIVNVGDDGPMYNGFTMHPTERFQLALQREQSLKEKGLESDLPPFVFVVNIIIPGPPFFHAVFYYAIDDMSTIDGTDESPSSRLSNDFFFGDSDAFRDKTFKLIPQIVQGNFIVRKAVGSTPAIMGKKLRQLYVKTPRSMEVILDCGSSSVATGVIRLSLGYAKTLVVDMGFLLEGDDESVLPERIFGCVRIKNLNFGSHLRKVTIPSTPTTATSTYDLPPPTRPSSPPGDGSVLSGREE